MKILMIGQKRYPNSRDGGIDVVVQNISEQLVKLGHEVTVLVRKRKDHKPPSEYNGVKIIEIFTMNFKRTDAIIYSYFATRYAKKNKFDVVHFHAEGNTLFLKKLRNAKDKKIVVTVHGLDWKRDKFKGIGRRILLKSEKAIVNYADNVITLCNNDKKYFSEKYNLDTTLIPNGFNRPVFLKPNIIKGKFKLIGNDYILFLARVVPEKGLHLLIDAYNLINNPKLKLVVAGGSSHSSEYYQEMVNKASNNKNIIFTGFVQGEELSELFSNAFLYVLPSTIEGMPLSLIEALSFEKICLCSDIEELKDIESKNIIYFKSEDISDLKNKLIELSDSNRTYKKESIFLDWQEVAKKTIELYERQKGE